MNLNNCSKRTQIIFYPLLTFLGLWYSKLQTSTVASDVLHGSVGIAPFRTKFHIATIFDGGTLFAENKQPRLFSFSGSYVCECRVGFTGDGRYCSDSENCTTDTCGDYVCEELVPGYRSVV